jgi:hypothetical protein
VAPGVVSSGSVSAFPDRVELQWQAAQDDNAGFRSEPRTR